MSLMVFFLLMGGNMGFLLFLLFAAGILALCYFIDRAIGNHYVSKARKDPNLDRLYKHIVEETCGEWHLSDCNFIDTRRYVNDGIPGFI